MLLEAINFKTKGITKGKEIFHNYKRLNLAEGI